MNNKRHTALLALIAVAIVAVLWWVYSRDSNFAHHEVRVRPKSVTPPPAAAPSSTVAVEETSTEAIGITEKTTPCREQPISIAVKDRRTTECFGSTVILQNGSVRTYRVDGTRDKQWELKIEAIAERVQSVRLSIGNNVTFGCTENNCSGIAISKHDAQGIRTISLTRALLRQSSGAPITEEVNERTAHVEGKLRTLPEGQVPGMSCPGQGVAIISNEGSSVALCPSGGAGYEILDDDGRRFEFSGVDTGTIYVTVDASNIVQKIDYDNGSFSCTGAECGGVSVSTPNEKGERRFAFFNTTLREVLQDSRPSGRFVIITGTLVLPGDL